MIQDMTGMLDSLLLLAKTGQPLHPRWGSLNEVVEHAAHMVRAHPDARNVDVVIQNGTPIACWMDSARLGSAVYNLLLNACQAARLGLAYPLDGVLSLSQIAGPANARDILMSARIFDAEIVTEIEHCNCDAFMKIETKQT